MIGTPLSLVLPSLSDTMANVVAKTATALAAIQTYVEDQATPAALNVNGNLSFGGNAATDVGYVGLVAGQQPTAPGSVYYYSGEFYLVDSTGTIRLNSAR